MKNLKPITNHNSEWINCNAEIKSTDDGFSYEVHNNTESFIAPLESVKNEQPDYLLELITKRLALWIEHPEGLKALEALQNHYKAYYLVKPTWAVMMSRVRVVNPNNAA